MQTIPKKEKNEPSEKKKNFVTQVFLIWLVLW